MRGIKLISLLIVTHIAVAALFSYVTYVFLDKGVTTVLEEFDRERVISENYLIDNIEKCYEARELAGDALVRASEYITTNPTKEQIDTLNTELERILSETDKLNSDIQSNYEKRANYPYKYIEINE